MTKRILLVALVPVIALAVWAIRHKSLPPDISFTKVHRETLISNLITNGKTEPVEWQDIRVDNQGLVTRVAVKEGQTVAKGALVASLSEPGLSEELNGAQAREAQARAALQTLNQGGK